MQKKDLCSSIKKILFELEQRTPNCEDFYLVTEEDLEKLISDGAYYNLNRSVGTCYSHIAVYQGYKVFCHTGSKRKLAKSKESQFVYLIKDSD